MKKNKMVFLVGCLVFMLACSVPQVVGAFNSPEEDDQEIIFDSDATAPELGEDEEPGEEDAFGEREDFGELEDFGERDDFGELEDFGEDEAGEEEDSDEEY